ncbi:MAG: 16S rRNA (guanine(966)-N(2))-methyltransferase RsmD [Rickettsiales bacterium]
MRIIAGAFKGRKLKEFEGDAIRPTGDRTRESLFNLLMHGAYGGDDIIGCHVVDLCCGTGALGLEALSRGARMATFIDKDKRAIALARDNATHCGTLPLCQFLTADATRLPPAHTPAQLVVIDAPYDTPILASAYDALERGQWFAPGALLVAEMRRGTKLPTLIGVTLCDSREYGKAALHLYRRDA